jgi:hypothetical protein
MSIAIEARQQIKARCSTIGPAGGFSDRHFDGHGGTGSGGG